MFPFNKSRIVYRDIVPQTGAKDSVYLGIIQLINLTTVTLGYEIIRFTLDDLDV